MNKIIDKITENLEEMLKDISITYSLDFEELKTKYINKPNETIIIEQQVEVPKKRGRKKKQKEEYIEAEEIEFEGKTYLVDDKNNVYTNNIDFPTLIGEKLVNGNIKFYK